MHDDLEAYSIQADSGNHDDNNINDNNLSSEPVDSCCDREYLPKNIRRNVTQIKV